MDNSYCNNAVPEYLRVSDISGDVATSSLRDF